MRFEVNEARSERLRDSLIVGVALSSAVAWGAYADALAAAGLFFVGSCVFSFSRYWWDGRR